MMGAAPLAGIKVLDFTLNLPGPYATSLLASLGADVVKVEPPSGDPARNVGTLFERLNGGKKSIVLDLSPGSDDRRWLEPLLRWADVVVEGFRPGVMARLGADEATARRLNPTIVYCSISAWGQDGPRSGEPGHDLNCQASTGFCWVERDEQDKPRPTVIPVADLSASLAAVASICAELVARERGHTVEGTLDVGMSDALLSWTLVWGQGVDLRGDLEKKLESSPFPSVARAAARPLLRRLERLKLYALPQYGLYRCLDSRFVALGIVEEQRFWKTLCDVLDLPWLGGLTAPTRTLLGPILTKLIAARLARLDRDEALRRLCAADLPVTPVSTTEEALRDPQFKVRGLVDARGRARAPLPQASTNLGAAPSLGEHTSEILGSLS